MGTAYTPGLRVTRHAVIEKTRRLPLRGQTLVEQGAPVAAADIVARAELPGLVETVRLDQEMGLEPVEVKGVLRVKPGDHVEKGQMLAESKAFFGLIKSAARAPIAGTVEFFSETTGHLGIRRPPSPVEVNAYIDGRVAAVIPQEGVVVRSHGAIVQGIFGVGGERRGELAVCATAPDAELQAGDLRGELKGKVVVGGALARLEAIRRAAELGARGLVVGGVIDRDLAAYVGYDIGVAVTGHEPVPLTLIVTEGFGHMAMAARTFELLGSLAGRTASINGATQIRAGALRPEIIVTDADAPAGAAAEAAETSDLAPGTPIRLIRVPYFGLLGRVADLPHEPVQIQTGAWVRVLTAELADGRRVTVPRANVEILQG